MDNRISKKERKTLNTVLRCLVERAVAVIRDEQTKEALLRELDAATGAENK